MCRELVHIYGPLSVQTFGVAIILGFLVISLLMPLHPWYKRYFKSGVLLEGLTLGLIIAIIGARTLYVLHEWDSFDSWWEILAFWEGGLSVLGGIIACTLFLPAYLYYKKVNIVACLDIGALYVPLWQAIARIGCFCAGCCYGIETTVPWGVTFIDPQGFAPVGIRLHPTQLYSSFLLLGIFIFMFGVAQRYFRKPGQLGTLYLFLASMERFVVDFWRDENIPAITIGHTVLSWYQVIALSIALCAVGGFVFATLRQARRYSS